MDIETRRQKQKALMARIVERKVRERAQQLYDERGQEDGQALKDWVQAESEVLGKTVIGQLYRKVKIVTSDPGSSDIVSEADGVGSPPRDTSA